MRSDLLKCRSCGSPDLYGFADREEAVFCSSCSLIQRVSPSHEADSRPPAHLSNMRDRAGMARQLISARGLGIDSLVIEAGSRDGERLRPYRDAGIPVLGVEETLELARVARHRHGILTREGVFSRTIANKLRVQDLRCDLFHANDVIAHVTDLNDFVRGIRQVLKDDGMAVIETPYLPDLIEKPDSELLDPGREYCFSLTSLCRCLAARGLVVTDVELLNEDVSLLRVYAVPALPGVRSGERVVAVLSSEATWGVDDPATYGLHSRSEAA